MKRNLVGVVAVLIAALLFAGCVTVEVPVAETTTTTISKDQICAEIYKKNQDAIKRGTAAAIDKALASIEGKSQLEINRLQSNYDSALMEAKQFGDEFTAKSCPLPK
jgi:PBP1b-binding outer membrane lipoprotein LpoB